MALAKHTHTLTPPDDSGSPSLFPSLSSSKCLKTAVYFLSLQIHLPLTPQVMEYECCLSPPSVIPSWLRSLAPAMLLSCLFLYCLFFQTMSTFRIGGCHTLFISVFIASWRSGPVWLKELIPELSHCHSFSSWVMERNNRFWAFCLVPGTMLEIAAYVFSILFTPKRHFCW